MLSFKLWNKISRSTFDFLPHVQSGLRLMKFILPKFKKFILLVILSPILNISHWQMFELLSQFSWKPCSLFELCDELQMPQFMPTPECDWRDYCQEPASLPEMPFTQCPLPPRSLPWQSPAIENGTAFHVWTVVMASAWRACVCFTCSSVCTGYQLRASIYSSYSPADSQPSPFALDASLRSAEALSGVSVFPVRNPSSCGTYVRIYPLNLQKETVQTSQDISKGIFSRQSTRKHAHLPVSLH